MSGKCYKQHASAMNVSPPLVSKRFLRWGLDEQWLSDINLRDVRESSDSGEGTNKGALVAAWCWSVMFLDQEKEFSKAHPAWLLHRSNISKLATQVSKLGSDTPPFEAWALLANGCVDLKKWTAMLRPGALQSLTGDLMVACLERVDTWKPPETMSKQEAEVVKGFLEASAAMWEGETMFAQELQKFKLLQESQALEGHIATLKAHVAMITAQVTEEELRAVEVAIHKCSGQFLTEKDKEGQQLFLTAADSLCIWDGFNGCVEKVRRASDLAVMLLEMVPCNSDQMATILAKLTCVQEALQLPQLLTAMKDLGGTFAEQHDSDDDYVTVRKVMLKMKQVQESWDMIPSAEAWAGQPRVQQFVNWRKAIGKRVDNFVAAGSGHWKEQVTQKLDALRPWAGGCPEGKSWTEGLDEVEDEWENVKNHAEESLLKQDLKQLECLIADAEKAGSRISSSTKRNLDKSGSSIVFLSLLCVPGWRVRLLLLSRLLRPKERRKENTWNGVSWVAVVASPPL